MKTHAKPSAFCIIAMHAQYKVFKFLKSDKCESKKYSQYTLLVDIARASGNNKITLEQKQD